MLYFTSKGLSLTFNSFKLGFITCVYTWKYNLHFLVEGITTHGRGWKEIRFKVSSNTNQSGILCAGDSVQVHLLGPF